MYAWLDNAWKYQDRDKRIAQYNKLEFHYLGPDSKMMEVFKKACRYLEDFMVVLAFFNDIQPPKPPPQTSAIGTVRKVRNYLSSEDPIVDRLDILPKGWGKQQQKRSGLIKSSASPLPDLSHKLILQYYPPFIASLKIQIKTHIVRQGTSGCFLSKKQFSGIMGLMWVDK